MMPAKAASDGLWNEIDNDLDTTFKHQGPDISSLPENTIPFLLHEAVRHYSSDNPPFLTRRSRKFPPGTRRRVRLAAHGKQPDFAIEADLVLRAWEEDSVYWTLDLDGRRLILRAFSGGPGGGMNYRRWDGVQNGFFEEAVAYGSLRQMGNAVVGLAEEPSLGPISDGESRQTPPVRRQSARGANRKFVPNWESRSRSYPLSSHGFSPPPMPNRNIPRSAEPLRPRPTKRKPVSDNDLPPKVRKTRKSRRRFTSPKRQRPSRNTRNDDDQPNELHAPPPAPTSASPPTVSEYRQNNTILYVFLNTNEDPVPLKLCYMMTMSTFFASVLEAFDLQGHEDEVKALRITFDSLPKGEREASWLMKRNILATFERFLEVVNGLSVWETEGKCSIEVNILMRD